MYRSVAFALVVVTFVAVGVPALSRVASAATCGRSDYPDPDDFADEFVVDRDLWNAFVSSGGFANGTQDRAQVSAFVVGPTRNYTVTLNESVLVEYVGGVATNRTTVNLGVRVEERDGRGTDRALAPVSMAGRG